MPADWRAFTVPLILIHLVRDGISYMLHILHFQPGLSKKHNVCSIHSFIFDTEEQLAFIVTKDDKIQLLLDDKMGER